MRSVFCVVLIGTLFLASASPISALSCETWDQLYYVEDRRAVVQDEVWAILDSGGASSWNVNHNKIGRCVMRSLDRLIVDIDDTCALGGRVSMQAIDGLIMNYIRSCVY